MINSSNISNQSPKISNEKEILKNNNLITPKNNFFDDEDNQPEFFNKSQVYPTSTTSNPTQNIRVKTPTKDLLKSNSKQHMVNEAQNNFFDDENEPNKDFSNISQINQIPFKSKVIVQQKTVSSVKTPNSNINKSNIIFEKKGEKNKIVPFFNTVQHQNSDPFYQNNGNFIIY